MSFSYIVLRLFTSPLLLLQSLQNIHRYFWHRYHYYHITLLLNNVLHILSFPGVVELTTQLLILENILWLPCAESINLGWILYPRKLLRSPILVGYHTCYLSKIHDGYILWFLWKDCWGFHGWFLPLWNFFWWLPKQPWSIFAEMWRDSSCPELGEVPLYGKWRHCLGS